MNKQIEDLMYRAGLTAQGCWDQMDEYDQKAIEKLTELIVRECLNEIQSLLDCNTQVDEFEQGVYNGLDMAKDCIKEHFGVEE